MNALRNVVWLLAICLTLLATDAWAGRLLRAARSSEYHLQLLPGGPTTTAAASEQSIGILAAKCSHRPRCRCTSMNLDATPCTLAQGRHRRVGFRARRSEIGQWGLVEYAWGH